MTTKYEELLAGQTNTSEAKQKLKLEIDTQVGISRLLNSIDLLRANKGWTKADLARAAGMQPANLRKLMSTGERNFEVETLVRLLSALGAKLEVTSGIGIDPASSPRPERVSEPVGKRIDQSQFVEA